MWRSWVLDPTLPMTKGLPVNHFLFLGLFSYWGINNLDSMTSRSFPVLQFCKLHYILCLNNTECFPVWPWNFKKPIHLLCPKHSEVLYSHCALAQNIHSLSFYIHKSWTSVKAYFKRQFLNNDLCNCTSSHSLGLYSFSTEWYYVPGICLL